MLTIRYDVLGVGTGDRLLDLGCGAGRHTYEGMKRAAEVIAADLDAGVLKEVRDVAAAVTAETENSGRIAGAFRCVSADALRLPFRHGAFDKAIVSEVLEHIAADEDALAEVGRVMRPGGEIAISVPRELPERVCWRLSDRYHADDGGHVRIYRRAELFAKIRRAGFTILHSHHAHALHVPYWWLKCAVGIDRPDHPLVTAYHRFLVWDIERSPRAVRYLERLANPLIGKSLVVYARKEAY